MSKSLSVGLALSLISISGIIGLVPLDARAAPGPQNFTGISQAYSTFTVFMGLNTNFNNENLSTEVSACQKKIDDAAVALRDDTENDDKAMLGIALAILQA